MKFPFVGGAVDGQELEIDHNGLVHAVGVKRGTVYTRVLYTRRCAQFGKWDRHYFFAPEWMTDEKALPLYLEFIGAA